MYETNLFTSLRQTLPALSMVGCAALACSLPAHADALRTNGVCELNDCNNIPVTSANSSSSTDFNFTYQFANSDTYRLQGTIFQGQTASGATFYDEIGPSNFIVTYLGNSTETASDRDTLSTEFLGSYPSEIASAGYFNSDLRSVFGPGLGLASSAGATFTVDGQRVSSLGPISPPPRTFDTADEGNVSIIGGAQSLDYDYTLIFGQGSNRGSSIELYPTAAASPVPEPSSYLLLGTGLLGIGCLGRRRTVPR